jgi:lipoprotein NlpI
MLRLKVPFAVILLSCTAASTASEFNAQFAAAREKYLAHDFDGSLQELEPLLKAGELDQPSKQQASVLASRVLKSRGEERFRQARIAESIADFDRQIELQPDQAADHWQRGIAYYYRGKYEKGARQFELHRTVNPQDVENAAWHFLCIIRTPTGSVDVARKKLISVSRDSRVPMAQIRQLYAGTITPQEVLRVGDSAGGAAKFYADLYVGLYFEALGQSEESLRLVTQAAENPAAQKSYMGDVARVHVILRKRSASSAQLDR